MKILSLFWCFILTIWNVNSPLSDVILESLLSFILTIWNVNHDRLKKALEQVKGFILTIWNVNGSFVFVHSHPQVVLY
ncbi:hypothetical protein QW1_1456 [Clostridioides difficile P73]|nr:hypothetical protein QW1_1456 [Clostridioides difficile P73]HAT4764087.1 hypothetical protein [Clostridioides difficile]